MLGHRSLRQILAALAVLMPLLAGCGNKVIGIPPKPPPPAAPIAATPELAVQRLAWCWNARDTTGLEDLFTADYVYAFGDTDTVTVHSWFRDEELLSSRHLFVDGTPTEPPATSITFLTDPSLVDGPDSRPGHNARWHRELSTLIIAGIRTDAGFYAVIDHAKFFAVRGDSAKIPQVLKDRGVTPDSTRWWIDRWESDSEVASAANAAQPARTVTLASVKALYLPLPHAMTRARF